MTFAKGNKLAGANRRRSCPIALEIRRLNRSLLGHHLVCRGDCVRPDRGKYEECGIVPPQKFVPKNVKKKRRLR